MANYVNVYTDYAFQVAVQTRNAAGVLATPTLGAVTGITLRLSLTPTGAAIHANVGNLSATETTTAGLFGYVMDTALMQTHLLPLGAGATFYAIWSKSGDMDMESVTCIVKLGNA